MSRPLLYQTNVFVFISHGSMTFTAHLMDNVIDFSGFSYFTLIFGYNSDMDKLVFCFTVLCQCSRKVISFPPLISDHVESKAKISADAIVLSMCKA